MMQSQTLPTKQSSKYLSSKKVSSGLYSVADVIRITGISRQRITKDIKEGKLPSRCIGAQYVMTRSDLVTWLGSEQRVNDLLAHFHQQAA